MTHQKMQAEAYGAGRAEERGSWDAGHQEHACEPQPPMDRGRQRRSRSSMRTSPWSRRWATRPSRRARTHAGARGWVMLFVARYRGGVRRRGLVAGTGARRSGRGLGLGRGSLRPSPIMPSGPSPIMPSPIMPAPIMPSGRHPSCPRPSCRRAVAHHALAHHAVGAGAHHALAHHAVGAAPIMPSPIMPSGPSPIMPSPIMAWC